MRLIVVPTITVALSLLVVVRRWRTAGDAYPEAHQLAAARAVTSRLSENEHGGGPPA